MRKTYIIILSCLCSLMALAQRSLPGYEKINPEIRTLISRIDSLGIESELLFNRDAKRAIRYWAEPMLYVETDDTIKQEGMKRVVDTNGKEHFVGDRILKPLPKEKADSIRKIWRDNRLTHEAIMNTIKHLTPECEMMNHYEVHCNGMDTVEVSAVLNKEKNEYVEYSLRTFRSRSEIYNTLRAFPVFKYNCTIDDDAKAYNMIDIDDFMGKVKPIFNHRTVNMKKAVYEHDGDYQTEEDNAYAIRIHRHDGNVPYNSRTDATIYQCTSREQAEEMLRQLIKLIWQYTDEHKDVSYYEFQPLAGFTDWTTEEVIAFESASRKKSTMPLELRIVLHKTHNEELYYFGFLNTQGDLWLPLDWTTIEHSKLTNEHKDYGLTGSWKLSKQTLQQLGINYDTMKGKINFKTDSTFIVTINGRGVGGHSFLPHRTVSVKLHGTYSVKDNSITFNLKRDDIKCHINDDAMDNDPKQNPSHTQGRTTWDAADRQYETAKDHGSMQEKIMKDDIHTKWPYTVSITFINQKKVQIGAMIHLTR